MAQQNKDTNELIKVRRQKLADLQAAGKNPFEIMKYDVTHHSKEIKDNFEELEGKEVAVAGRLMFKRVMGKASFCNVQDLQGGIQAYVARDEIVDAAQKAKAAGAVRFSIVTSGRGQSKADDFDNICKTLIRIREEVGIEICASLGILTEAQAFELKKIGVIRWLCLNEGKQNESVSYRKQFFKRRNALFTRNSKSGRCGYENG